MQPGIRHFFSNLVAVGRRYDLVIFTYHHQRGSGDPAQAFAQALIRNGPKKLAYCAQSSHASDYLEAAFLVRRVERVDRNARRFQRAVTFKTYLTNPALRAALFGQITADDEHMGSVAESAVFAQWFHDVELVRHIKYARWDTGEVDIVSINPGTQSPQWVVEVKWSDRYLDRPSELSALIDFVERHPAIRQPVLVTTRTKHGLLTFRGVQIEFRPASEYCYTVGKNIVESLNTSIPERDQLELGL